MAQLVRIVCVPTSSGLTPRVFFPMIRTADLIVARTCVAVMRTSLFFDESKNVLTVDWGVVPLYVKTRCTVSAQQWTGHSGSCFDLCCVMVAIFSPFF